MESKTETPQKEEMRAREVIERAAFSARGSCGSSASGRY
jgi:hypothetical protein